VFAFPQTRLPRFRRASGDIDAMHLTARDLEIVRNVARHRFLRSTHIVSLLDESPQQVLRRLQLLFHHGYLDRPRAQLSYFHEGGSQAIVYGLGNRGAEALVAAEELERQKVDWTAKNREAKGLYIGHTLAVADVMVAMELACRATGRIRLLREEELAGRIKLADPFRWTVQVQGNRLGIVPDRVFGLEDLAQGSRCFYFLEADRATMPAVRSKLPDYLTARPPSGTAYGFLPVETAVSKRRCNMETRVSKSSASCSVMVHVSFGLCAVTFLNAPNMPTKRLINPVCSLRSVSVRNRVAIGRYHEYPKQRCAWQ
jgi:hypothetical protein